MKRLMFAYILLLLASCRNETNSNGSDQVLKDSITKSRTTVIKPITALPYSVEFDEITQTLNLKHSNEDLSGSDANDIIRVMNKKYPGIKLDLVKAREDTIYLKIDDATKLSQQMGSAGAEAYLAELTYSLTEIKGISAIRLTFEEGDHAMPGIYSRSDFQTFIKKK